MAADGSPADLDIQARLDTGPSHDTLNDIYQALRGLGNAELTSLVGQIVPLVQNGARRGMGPVVCDAACVNNTN